MRFSLSLSSTSRTFAAFAALAFAAGLPAQTLAHPGWAGNGVTVESWWRRAVFYRIDPNLFQDSDGDGKGDLPGLIERFDYLQTLGVDAVILQSSTPLLPSDPGVDDLFRAAASHHLRLLVSLGAPESQAADSDDLYRGLARAWLNQGAAGVFVPTAQVAAVDGGGHVARLLHDLRALCNSFPGERVLVADAAPNVDSALTSALAKEAQLTASKPISMDHTSAADLRVHLALALGEDSNPLLLSDRVPKQASAAEQDGLDRTLAAMLLGSRAAVVIDAGQELGILSAAATVMPWTPTNVTRKMMPTQTLVASDATENAPVYSGFTAYIPPLLVTFFPPEQRPLIVVVDDPHNAVLDPDALPGFSSIAVDAALTAVNAATANVAVEEGDAASLLSFYRHLIQLHHDNVSLRNGVQTVVEHDTENAVVWIRRVPAGSVTASTVVVACNVSDKPVTLDLARELGGHGGWLRALAGSPEIQGQSAEKLVLAPYSVFVGTVAR